MLREEQDPPCETSAEQYEPTSVSTVLGNPDGRASSGSKKAAGKRRSSGRPPRLTSPGSASEYHLELPGDPLGDTCVYARDFARLKREGRAPPTTYAHIARQVGRPGLVVQYWFFWYFNQFNDLHEGDWEGMQIAFEAETARQALRRRPERNDPLPARRRRARRLGRLEGGEGRDSPGGLSGGRLARDLLRLDRLRPERRERLRGRLRQHQRTAARSAGPPGRDPDLPHHRRPLQVAHLLRPLGSGGEGLQQRPDRAADQDAVARTVLLDGRAAERRARGCQAARSPGPPSAAPSAAPSPPSPT